MISEILTHLASRGLHEPVHAHLVKRFYPDHQAHHDDPQNPKIIIPVGGIVLMVLTALFFAVVIQAVWLPSHNSNHRLPSRLAICLSWKYLQPVRVFNVADMIL